VINLLSLHPYIAVRTDEPSIRRLRAALYPYIVFSEVAVDEIVIHAIRHTARDPAGMPGPR
jgi:toxin ParE1/3/4